MKVLRAGRGGEGEGQQGVLQHGEKQYDKKHVHSQMGILFLHKEHSCQLTPISKKNMEQYGVHLRM